MLLDEFLANSELSNFIDELIILNNEEEIYKLWLHKVYDKSFKDFKEQVLNSSKAVNESKVENVTETITQSMKILESYKPEERG